MKSQTEHLSSIALGIAGVLLFGTAALTLNREGKLSTDQNPLAIKQSAYGKLLARMSESTIDRVWHMGVEQITPHGAGGCGGCGDDHCHDESCSHEDDADTFTFHVDDDGNVTEETSSEENHGHPELDLDHDHDHLEINLDHDHHAHDDHDHDHHAHDDHDHDHHAHDDHDHEVSSGQFLLGKTPKEWLQNASIVRYKRTNPRSLSERHHFEVKKDVEQMLLRSYKMDPAHYGAYNSYHLFLTTHEFGGTEQTKAHARKIAEHTLGIISHEKEDPEAWLTAAAAASNLYFMEAEAAALAGESVPVESLREHRNRVAFCLSQFAMLQEAALKNGTWENVPQKRQMEIESRSRFALKTFEQFDAMIARAESKDDSKPEGEMVGGIVIP